MQTWTEQEWAVTVRVRLPRIAAAALLGAAFLMVVDDVARVAASSEIPLGILTALIGAPVFLYLILTGGTQRET